MKKTIAALIAAGLVWLGTAPEARGADPAAMDRYTTLKFAVDEHVRNNDYRGAENVLGDFIAASTDPELAAMAKADLADVYMATKEFAKAAKLYDEAMQVLGSTDATQAIAGRRDGARRQIALIEIDRTRAELSAYYAKNFRYPDTLDALGSAAAPFDPWGRKYVYLGQTLGALPEAGNQDYLLYSSGAEGGETLGAFSRPQRIADLRAALSRQEKPEIDLRTYYSVKSVYAQGGHYRAVLAQAGYFSETFDVKTGDTTQESIRIEAVSPEGVVLSKDGTFGAVMLENNGLKNQANP